MKQFTFPKKFLFGAATSAYQIEGAHDEDGRGPSTWDTFCQIPGRIHGNENGNAACDHYHRLPEDLGLMTQLNLESYRFSISWPRIFPEGGGRVNQGGVDFYNRLIDGLAARGIRPFATLFHWDLPQSLQDQYGGWKSKETSRNFFRLRGFLREDLWGQGERFCYHE